MTTWQQNSILQWKKTKTTHSQLRHANNTQLLLHLFLLGLLHFVHNAHLSRQWRKYLHGISNQVLREILDHFLPLPSTYLSVLHERAITIIRQFDGAHLQRLKSPSRFGQSVERTWRLREQSTWSPPHRELHLNEPTSEEKENHT